MTYTEIINYIENATYDRTRLGLSRTVELCRLLGNPQDDLRFVHVTGSNGKGSVCAFLSSILTEAGYRTGLYVSPQFEIFNDRMRICGENAADEMIEKAGNAVVEAAKSMEDHPSQFEMITALAFLLFKNEGCDIVVLEVGMGGETDSTNVIKNTEVAVINNICLEHTEYLGNTIEEIARVKAGIIKPGCDVVVFNSSEDVIRVVKEKAGKHKAEIFVVEPQDFSMDEESGEGHIADADSRISQIKSPLTGSFQKNNLVVALKAVERLNARKYNISEENILNGIKKVRWPARFEILREAPLFILDGGHNLQCALAVRKTLAANYGNERFVLLIGVLKDKDYEEEIKTLKDYVSRAVCITPENGRALPAAELSKICNQNGIDAVACDTIEAGVKLAMSYDRPVLAFGSLYSAGRIRKAVLQMKDD